MRELYNVEYRTTLLKASNVLQGVIDEFASLADSTRDKEKRFLYTRLAGICSNLASLYMVGINLTQDVNMLLDMIEKLPKEPQFDELRKQVEKIKEERHEVTVQVPKELETELKEWLAERQRAKKTQGQCVT